MRDWIATDCCLHLAFSIVANTMLCSNKTNPSPFVHPLMPTQAWNNEMCFKEKIANLETVYLNSLLWSSNGHGPVYVQILVARSKANHSCEYIPKAA